MVIPQVVLSLFPTCWSWPLRLAVTLAPFPVSGVLIGIVMGVSMGYRHWREASLGQLVRWQPSL